jgi:hypothetical protein
MPVGLQPFQLGEVVNARGSVSGAQTIDFNLGNIVTATATGAVQWTATNPCPTGKGTTFMLILTNGGVGTQTWMTGTKWEGGTAPTLPAAGVSVLVFTTIDGGTIWRGIASVLDSK